MDHSIIRSAMSGLESELERARDAKRQIEGEYTVGTKSYGYEDAEAAFPYFLNRVYDMFVVVLEASSLIDTRNRLIKRWAEFERSGGIGRTRYDAQFDYLESKPFEYLETLIDSLRISTGESLDSIDAYSLSRLEALLRDTPRLLRNRGVVPMREQDIQNVMHDYLGAFFIEYRHPVTITGITKDYKPDGGVRNLKAAIEFKYADSREAVSRALGGIFEDSRGYNGSLDWTRFYSVVYQTEWFESEGRIRSEMSRGGVTWKAILVTGGPRIKRGPRQQKLGKKQKG